MMGVNLMTALSKLHVAAVISFSKVVRQFRLLLRFAVRQSLHFRWMICFVVLPAAVFHDKVDISAGMK